MHNILAAKIIYKHKNTDQIDDDAKILRSVYDINQTVLFYINRPAH